jgi:hypothetical protein
VATRSVQEERCGKGRKSKRAFQFDCRPRTTERSRRLYQSRGTVEREFGRPSTNGRCYRSAYVAWTGVRLHADLTILAKLSCTLAKQPAARLAA